MTFNGCGVFVFFSFFRLPAALPSVCANAMTSPTSVQAARQWETWKWPLAAHFDIYLSDFYASVLLKIIIIQFDRDMQNVSGFIIKVDFSEEQKRYPVEKGKKMKKRGTSQISIVFKNLVLKLWNSNSAILYKFIVQPVFSLTINLKDAYFKKLKTEELMKVETTVNL